MTIYTVRQSFTLLLDGVIYLGGENVDLNKVQFERVKHKLEGVEPTAIINQGNNGGSGNGDCCFPAPYLASINPNVLLINDRIVLTISGSFFTPDMTVDLGENITINSIDFVSDNLILVSVTALTNLGFNSLILNNGSEAAYANSVEVIDQSVVTIDLRLGGTDFSNAAIRLRQDMSFDRTTAGMIFTGANPWESWVKFVGDGNQWVWNRDIKRKVSWIFTSTNSFMVGIGSDETDEGSTTQYNQGEIMSYMFSATGFYGFYGNDGTPGNTVNQNVVNTSVTSGSVRKVVLENNGEPGSNFYLYELPSSDIGDWADTSNLIRSGTVASNMRADAQNIMPFCVPRISGCSLLGFILE